MGNKNRNYIKDKRKVFSDNLFGIYEIKKVEKIGLNNKH